MSHPLFTDTVTAYRREGDRYVRRVLKDVQWRQKTERLNDNGRIALATVTSVTIPKGIEIAVKPGDVLVLGVGPAITDEYTIAQLRADKTTYCTVKAVADNTLRPKLKHWRVTAI
jgi:hypothetical protein